VATALGPVVGGLLIALGGPEFGWRLVFFITLPIGVTFILLYFCGSTGLPLVLTLYLQQGIGFEPLHAAIAVTSLTVGSAEITPNQTLSLADVDRRIGGSAGGVLQTSQRVGAAIGQAAIAAAIAVTSLAALVLGLLEARSTRRRRFAAAPLG
jgi:MFS family permease